MLQNLAIALWLSTLYGMTRARKPRGERPLLDQHRRDGPRLVADAVLARRKSFGIPVAEVERRGGPGRGTVAALEQGEKNNYDDDSLNRLEDVFGWTRGSVETISQGGKPVELPNFTPPQARAPAAPAATADADVAAEDHEDLVQWLLHYGHIHGRGFWRSALMEAQARLRSPLGE